MNDQIAAEGRIIAPFGRLNLIMTALQKMTDQHCHAHLRPDYRGDAVVSHAVVYSETKEGHADLFNAMIQDGGRFSEIYQTTHPEKDFPDIIWGRLLDPLPMKDQPPLRWIACPPPSRATHCDEAKGLEFTTRGKPDRIWELVGQDPAYGIRFRNMSADLVIAQYGSVVVS